VSLKAEAWHHRSDALSSIGSFAGVLGARLGVPILDPVAAIVICLFIFKVAFSIFKESIDRLVDRSCGELETDEMVDAIKEVPGVLRVDDIKTRLFGSRTYVDIEIAADGELKLKDAHAIAQAAHDRMEAAFPDVKHCTVHVNPINMETLDEE
jgi:cation diffusion facilitator family transporter